MRITYFEELFVKRENRPERLKFSKSEELLYVDGENATNINISLDMLLSRTRSLTLMKSQL